jgi:hypothetical protein
VVSPEDTPAVFAASGSNKIAVADVDNATLTVDLTVTNGTLKLQVVTGLTFNAGADNTAAMNFTGTVADINAALDGIRYNPTQDYTGPANIGITVGDGLLNTPQHVGLDVTHVNDPPVNNLPATAQTNEDTPLAFTGANLISVQDVDAGTFIIRVDVAVTNGVFSLNPAADLTILGFVGNGTAAVSINGPLPAINAALNGSTYTPALNFNTNDTGVMPTLTLTTNDNGYTGAGPLIDTDTLTITVTPVNDPPVANDDGSPTNRTTVLWNTTDNLFDVLANDNTGPDTGETLTIMNNVDTSNAHGTVRIENGKLLYTPTAGYTGDAEIVYTVNDRADGSGLEDTATVYVTVVDFVPSDVSGYVYFDADNDGIKDPGEWGIGGVLITLTGVNIQGNPESRSALTDETGMYEFTDLMPSNTETKYTLTEFHPAALVDGKDTAGDQGAEMSANDQMRIYLPLFGYAEGILGAGNNFGELGFRAEFAGQGLHDLIHSGPNGGGLLIGTDLSGNLQWYMNLGGWEGYIPGLASPTSPSGFNAAIHDGKLSLTGGGTVQEIDSTDVAIRSMFSRAGGLVTSILGDAGDFGLPMPLAAAGGEGEGNSLTAVEDDGLSADGGNTGDYEAAVDALFAGIV